MQQSLQKMFNQPIGIIGDGEFDLQDITVSTLQSLLSITKAKSVGAADKRKVLMKYFNKVGMVASDEAHLYDSESVGKVMPFFTNADKFFGFSATPYGWGEKAEKRQNLELEQHFGQVIYDTRKNNFIELGLKAPLMVSIINRVPVRSEYMNHMKRSRYGKLSPDHTKNYREALETELLNNPSYHAEIAQIAWEMATNGRSCFVHAPHNLNFSSNIHKLIPGAALVNGKTPRLKRREIYDAMRKKELLTLVSDIGGTGLDIPSLDALVLAGDMVDIRQLKGRVERAAPGKVSGLLIDVNTDTQFLSKHHSTRRSQYEADKNIIIG
jgi:superfamily II DNA or RNA helicase